jgi:CRP-like cAMP-binding protein
VYVLFEGFLGVYKEVNRIASK